MEGFNDAEVKAIIEGANRAYAVGRGVVERQDLVQEAWLWVFENVHRVEQWREEKQRRTDSLRSACYHAGLRHVREVMKKNGGLEKHDFVTYSVDLVKDALPAIFAGEQMPAGPEVNEEIRHKQSPSEGGNGLVTIMDIRRGFIQLNQEQKQILWLLYGFPDATYEKVSAELDMPITTLRRREQRALETIIDSLGGPRVGWRRDDL